jgi:hypothetical protein
VVAEDALGSVETVEGDAKRRGVKYEVADGTLIENLGEKRFVGVTEDGLQRRVVAQVCGVNKSLLSVRRVVGECCTVVFKKGYGWIEDESGEKIWLTEKGWNVHGEVVGEEGKFLRAVEEEAAVEHVRPNVEVGGGKNSKDVGGRSDGEEIWDEIDKELKEELATRKSQKKVHWRETGVDGEVVDGESVEKPEGNVGKELAEELWEDAGIRREPKVRTRKSPGPPSVEERRRHEATHANYADWCRHCIRARGRNRPHKRKLRDEGEEKERVPRVAMDYNFAGEDAEETGKL